MDSRQELRQFIADNYMQEGIVSSTRSFLGKGIQKLGKMISPELTAKRVRKGKMLIASGKHGKAVSKAIQVDKTTNFRNKNLLKARTKA